MSVDALTLRILDVTFSKHHNRLSRRYIADAAHPCPLVPNIWQNQTYRTASTRSNFRLSRYLLIRAFLSLACNKEVLRGLLWRGGHLQDCLYSLLTDTSKWLNFFSKMNKLIWIQSCLFKVWKNDLYHLQLCNISSRSSTIIFQSNYPILETTNELYDPHWNSLINRSSTLLTFAVNHCRISRKSEITPIMYPRDSKPILSQCSL